MSRACSTNGGDEDCILVGKPKGKRPLSRQTRKWVDNIKMDLSGIGWDGMNWIYLAQECPGT
jgi:hypothetical protein